MGFRFRENDTTLRHTLLRQRCDDARLKAIDDARQKMIANAIEIAQQTARTLSQIHAANDAASAPHPFEQDMDAMLAADEAENQPELEDGIMDSVESDTLEEDALQFGNYLGSDVDNDFEN